MTAKKAADAPALEESQIEATAGVEEATASEATEVPAVTPEKTDCKCECECEFPYFAKYSQTWRAMNVTRYVTVLGRTIQGKLIVFHENMGIKTLDVQDVERV